MGKKSKRAKKAEETALREGLNKNVEAIQETPFEKARLAKVLNFETQSAGTGGIESIDAMKPYLDLYKGATSDQQNQRQSGGLLSALGQGSNNAGAANYETYMKMKRQQEAAGQLEGAYNATSADMTGQGFNLAQMANSRNLGKAGAGAQAYNTFMQNKGPGMFDKIMKIGQVAVGGVGAWKGCWIAAELYGETDIRTMLLRAWLGTEVVKQPIGRFIVDMYAQFGERVAAMVKRSKVLRFGFKKIFDRALVKAVRWAEGCK